MALFDLMEEVKRLSGIISEEKVKDDSEKEPEKEMKKKKQPKNKKQIDKKTDVDESTKEKISTLISRLEGVMDLIDDDKKGAAKTAFKKIVEDCIVTYQEMSGDRDAFNDKDLGDDEEDEKDNNDKNGDEMKGNDLNKNRGDEKVEERYAEIFGNNDLAAEKLLFNYKERKSFSNRHGRKSINEDKGPFGVGGNDFMKEIKRRSGIK